MLNLMVTFGFLGTLWQKALGYANVSKSIKDHVDTDDKTDLKALHKYNESLHLPKAGKCPLMIKESGLYSLILRSKLKTAKEFSRWITKDVLPSLTVSRL